LAEPPSTNATACEESLEVQDSTSYPYMRCSGWPSWQSQHHMDQRWQCC